MHNPNFSSGPCSKRPKWDLDALKDSAVGRSHRSSLGKEKLARAISESKRILNIPEDYLLGIFPGSDTGAFEAAMWTLLGPRPVTVLVWESFGEGWATDVVKQLKLNPIILKADYGKIPDLKAVDWSNDVVFVANGTTSGVKIPGWDWIPSNRQGLSICDGTSAAFAMTIDWSKVDVLTFSWQKCLGSEAGQGMLVLSPRAVAHIESYDPPWPMPKVFRMKKGGKLDRGIFEGETINTPSLLCVEDYLDALKWAGEIGLEGLIERSLANLKVVENWVEKTAWIDFLAASPDIRSSTSVCLSVVSEKVLAMTKEDRAKFLKGTAGELSEKGVAYDVASYRDAPQGFRFWCGPTIETEDIKAALLELERIYNEKVRTVSGRLLI
ncbi:MAG: phosphoserine transaminase [Syntrophobacteraceae bacterium CG23_combo_of_CG06-09_8_20_14_all_50_8]|nr:MAG: phosphoserine transaminase [Syntrophobacteraceae bacterium CG23_combo_of_CG06-09_8_20_14_all_50_8]